MLTPDFTIGKMCPESGRANPSRSWTGVFDVDGQLSVVRVLYSDESGTGSIKKEPITVTTAIMFNVDSQWAPVQADFAALPAARRRGELKGASLLKDIRKGRGRDANGTLRSVLAIPRKHGLPIFSVAVDRLGFQQATRGLLQMGTQEHERDAYGFTFSMCLDQVDRYVHTLIPREKILWISDHGGHYEQRLKSGLSWHALMTQMDVSKILKMDTSPTQERFSSHIADTIYFGHSHESRALQLADVCCSVITAHLIGERFTEPYYEMIRAQIVTEPTRLYA